MSRRPVYITNAKPEGHSVLLSGAVPEVTARYDVPAPWSNLHRGWWLRRERLADFEAMCAEAGVPVRRRGVGW